MIDELDRRLMLELQRNGRERFVDLARKLSVTEGTIRYRIKNLLDNNMMDIVGVPNIRNLGYGFVVIMGLVVKMADLEQVVEEIAKVPNVCYLATVTGQYDLMAIVVTRSQEELSRVLTKDISTIQGVLKTESFVNMEIMKGTAGLLNTDQLIPHFEVHPSNRNERKG